MRRRSLLRRLAGTASIAAGAAVAGCLGGGGPSGGGDLADHPASRSLEGQPYIGDPPTEAERLLVGFEDPTCPNCRSFHRGVLEDVRSEIIEPDSASLVWRPYRYTNRAWATDAILAVLAATARDRSAAWDLLTFYYDEQFSIGTGSFDDRTRSFLVDETTLDADAVLQDVDDRVHQDVLETAEDQGDAAGVSATPTFHLFLDGGHLTQLTNPADVTLIEAAFEA